MIPCEVTPIPGSSNGDDSPQLTLGASQFNRQPIGSRP